MAKAKIADAMSDEDMKQFDEMRQADKEPADDTSNMGGAAEPAPEPQATPDPEPSKPDTKADKKSTMVPHAALEEERQKRKAVEKEKQDLAIVLAKAEERQNLINQALEANQKKAQAPQKVEVPDPEKDALGAVKAMAHNARITEEENKILQDFRKNQEGVSQRVAYVNDIAAFGKAAEAEFSKTNPDYQEAMNHLMASRKQELMLYGANEAQANMRIAEEVISIAEFAKKNNANPAELLYKFANVRGYKKATASVPTPQTETERLANVAAGQRANMSASDINGAPPPTGKVDAKTLGSMPEEQFAKIMKSLTLEEKMALMGN